MVSMHLAAKIENAMTLASMKQSHVTLLAILFFIVTQNGWTELTAYTPSPSDAAAHYAPAELLVRLRTETDVDKLYGAGVSSVTPIFSPDTPAGQHPLLQRSYLVRFRPVAEPSLSRLEQLREQYENYPWVEAVQFNRLNRFCAVSDEQVVPTEPRYEEQWNLRALNLPKAWAVEQGTPEVIVAVVDSGIDRQHPELRSQLWQNANEIAGNGVDDDRNGYVDDINGWDFSDAPTMPGRGDWIERDNSPDDESGHGTHVAGIIAAESNNGIGIAGIAWHCRLMPLRAGFISGAGAFLQSDDVAAAIVYAADNGAHVINLSLGDTVNVFVVQDAIAYAYQRGCVLVAAAGNDATAGSYYPAALDTVISVAAVGENGRLSSISNFGATIDIAAPGDNILSTDLDGQFQVKFGTSMAAAHISGIAALMLSANPTCNNTEIRQTLTASSLVPQNVLVGTGLPDTHLALTAATGLVAQLSVSYRMPIIAIHGSAGGDNFAEYRLDFGHGETPTAWHPVLPPQTEPKFNARLHEWDVSGLADGTYTLRLRVTPEESRLVNENPKLKQRTTPEPRNPVTEKIVVEISQKAPTFSKHDASAWFAGDRIESVITWQTEALTIGEVEIFSPGASSPLRIARTDSVNQRHLVYLSQLGLPPSSFAYRLVTKTRSGVQTIDDNAGNLYPIEVLNARIPTSHLIQVASAERSLHAIAAADMNGNGKRELIAVDTEASGWNSPYLFEADADRTYRQVFTLSEPMRPWDSGDTDGDGLVEILGHALSGTFLLEQPAQGEFPAVRIWEAPALWGGTIADLDKDGIPEIFSRNATTSAIAVYEAIGNNSYRNIAMLKNPTDGDNNISTSFATGDFDGDGQMEILAGDADGGLFVYEATGDNQYELVWQSTLPEGRPQLFAAGELNRDGRAEFAVGAKMWTEDSDPGRYHWLITIFSQTSDDTYRAVWTQRIRNARDGGNGITIADADNDGRNELCIAVWPNFYLVRYDGIDYVPVWHHPASSTANPIVTDVDSDGRNELLFNSDGVLSVFAQSSESEAKTEAAVEIAQETPSAPPRLTAAVYSPPNQLLLTFDKQMGTSATQGGRYRLLHLDATAAGAPQSAILSRTQKRVVLTFPPGTFQSGSRYQLETFQIADIHGTPIAEDARTLTVVLPVPTLADASVYPNPTRCNQVTFVNLPESTRIGIYDVNGNRIASLTTTAFDAGKKVWHVAGISSGVYIYLLETDTEQRIGKVAIVR